MMGPRLGLEPREPARGSRRGLECPAVEGDSPVGVSRVGMGRLPEYRALVLAWESGGH